MKCKYCQCEILKGGENGYCDGCCDAERIEMELRNFILFITHQSEGDKDNNMICITSPEQLYEDVETFMREVYE